MAKSPIVATEEMSLEEALYLMQKYKIRRMLSSVGKTIFAE
jgi:CBS domain-containing protein